MDSIIFDVDGTLWDSTESVAQSWDRISAGKRTYGYYPDISPSDDTFWADSV